MAKVEKNVRLIEIARNLENVPWCDEYEKIISGMNYDWMVPELASGRHKARILQMQYNNCLSVDSTPESVTAEKDKILRKLLGKVGRDSYIESLLVEYGCNISVGDRFFANYNLTILDCSLVIIGDRVMVGPNVSIYTATHDTSITSRRADINYALDVSIGNDCWIGGNVIILPGVHIGEGCTIGAGSVVTKSIPAYSVAVGNPARVIKQVEKPTEDEY